MDRLKASLVALVLWWSGSLRRLWGIPVSLVAAALLVTTALCKSFGATALVLVAASALAAMRALGMRFGQGLQLTNILRDVPRDLRQGRCYLPRADLARLGLSPRDLLDPAAAATARPLVRELLQVALDRYDAGWRYTVAIPAGEPRMRLACWRPRVARWACRPWRRRGAG